MVWVDRENALVAGLFGLTIGDFGLYGLRLVGPDGYPTANVRSELGLSPWQVTRQLMVD